ncbi:MAG TPA: xanthine dehydrogenase family protein molybdopterin-binding subunit [Candidatus Dormibacteraeota bacterium]|nr:xanthine dehydrogenase family protein molybdopterin-binding subunit [Candidatus Dormibacteraeota bacterium]
MTSMVGAAVVRKEDPNLLTGRGTYVDNLQLPGMLHMAFVRSVEAHARVRAIDGTAAGAIPGVLGVFTARDLPELPPIPTAVPGLERPSLARDRVRFVGEPVAVVVAEDRYLAADAVARVAVDYDPLPPVPDLETALAEGAPLLFPEHGSNVYTEVPPAGDAEAELAAAPRRARLRLVNQRCAPAPMEPFGVVADWGPKGLTVWASCQSAHFVRGQLSQLLAVPYRGIRVIAPDVGGGFGAKQSWYPEYVVAALLSRRLGRPIKAVETRSENLVAMTHGRAQVQDVEVGFDDSGRILALRVMVTQDAGAYPGDAVGLPMLTMVMSAGCYRIPTVVTGYRAVATTTTPVAAYRGAGRPEAAYLIERVVDLVSDETGVDPIEVRRRNFLPADAFPHTTHLGFAYDSGDYDKALRRLLEMIDYEGLRREQAARREDPERPLMGIGFSTFVELGGVGPSAMMEGLGMLGGWESARARVNPDGTVTLAVGTSPHGQGHETAFAQIAADVLSLPLDRIEVVHGDTDVVQEGIGTFGSRSIAVGGEAVRRASLRAREKATRVAAHLLEAAPEDVELRDGRFFVRGSPDRGLGWEEVANKAYRPTQLGDLEPGIEVTAFYEPSLTTCPSGAHCCVVGVDRETGRVTVERYVGVDDCGVVINPLMARGQVMGGVAQGIAQALYEQVSYSESGQPLASTLAEYLVPSAAEMPRFELDHVETPTPVNPLGAKGLGESGATAAPQAVVNAVIDALSHLGVRDLQMPLTPERVWRAMQTATGGAV